MTKISKVFFTKKIYAFLIFIFSLSIIISGCKTTGKTGNIASNAVTVSDKDYKILAKGIIEMAQPQIEEITGRKYKDSKLKYEIVTRDDLRKLLIEEELPGIKKRLQGIDEDTIRRQLEISTESRSKNYAARYSILKKILYVIPDNIAPVAVRSGVDKEEMEDFIFLLIAHEMVHSLDDQYYDFMKQLGNCTNTDQLSAFGAVIDGSAAYVTNKIAESRGISDKTYINASKASLTIQDETSGAGKQNFDMYILKGAEFIKTVIAKKGPEGFTTAFTSPPASTRQVFFPEEYLNPTQISDINCNKLIESAKSNLNTDGMQSQTTTIGTMILQASLASQGLNKDEAEALGNSLIDGAAYTAIKQAVKPGIVMVQILNFKDEDGAMKFDEASKLIQKSQEAQFKAKLNTSYNVLKLDESIKEGFDFLRYKEIETKTDNESTNTKELTGITDNVYITIAYINSDEIVKEAMLDTMILIYDELKKMTHI